MSCISNDNMTLFNYIYIFQLFKITQKFMKNTTLPPLRENHFYMSPELLLLFVWMVNSESNPCRQAMAITPSLELFKVEVLEWRALETGGETESETSVATTKTLHYLLQQFIKSLLIIKLCTWVSGNLMNRWTNFGHPKVFVFIFSPNHNLTKQIFVFFVIQNAIYVKILT